MKMFNRLFFGAPTWSWLLAALPWTVMIPLNQLFWDDWVTAPLTGWDQQIIRWEGGAKHYANPLMYFLLLPLGQWFSQLLVLAATIAGAIAFSRVVQSTFLIGTIAANWSGPIFLAIPVFHSRFSSATLEYTFGLTATLCAWALLVGGTSARRQAASGALLIYAIGVPTLAVINLVMFVHLVARRTGRFGLRAWTRGSLRYLFVVAIPTAYALVFQVVLNQRGRYGFSRGATLEFLRGFLVVSAALAILALVVLASRRNRKIELGQLLFAVAAPYVALGPYFAVGYNPVADFLPWRARAVVIDGLPARLMAISIGLFAVGMIGYLINTRTSRSQVSISDLGLAIPIVFGTLMVGLGPMDWESRHWLVAWPALAWFFIVLLGSYGSSGQRKLVATAFLVLVFLTASISSEYVVDSLKQRALSREFAEQLGPRLVNLPDSGEPLVVFLKTDSAAVELNARYRGYRKYEWIGLIANSVRVPYSRVEVLEFDSVTGSTGVCTDLSPAVLVVPEIMTQRIESLLRFRVGVSVAVRDVMQCDGAVVCDSGNAPPGVFNSIRRCTPSS